MGGGKSHQVLCPAGNTEAPEDATKNVRKAEGASQGQEGKGAGRDQNRKTRRRGGKREEEKEN